MSTTTKLVREVKLVFFNDDANGEWGTAHKETYEGGNGDGFNAFWDGMGMFHDVFEHAHEVTDEYFRGDYAMNVGGEIAAMGACYYYTQMFSRLRNDYHTNESICINTTLMMMEEAVGSGYCNFGEVLKSGVPKQPKCKTDLWEDAIESYIEDYWLRTKKLKEKDSRSTDKYERQFARVYQNSITKGKIADLSRYGWRMAEKLCPDSGCYNGGRLSQFMSYWTEFCKANKAEDLANYFKELHFFIYRDSDDIITWKAKMIADPYAGLKDQEITLETECENWLYNLLEEVSPTEEIDEDQLTM